MANKHLHGQGLVLALTSSCMTTWYQMVNKFSSRPEVYDVAPGKSHESYNIIKMNPGTDVRDETYQFLQDTTTKLAKALNKLFNKDIFIPKINRGPDSLETLVAFKEAKGGIFQVKGSMHEGSASIFLTMPNEHQLQKAFAAMTGTPHPEDMIDDPGIEADPVAGDAIPEVGGDDGLDVPIGDDPIGDGDVSPESELDISPDEPDLGEPSRRFGESFRAYVAEAEEMYKVVYDDNGITKETIVKNEQQANQMARRKKGKVVTQMKEDADDRFIVKGIQKDGEETVIGTNSVGRMAMVDFEQNQIGLYKSVTLYDNGEPVKVWNNPKYEDDMEENVSVGQAIGSSAQATVYTPNSHNGFTGGPFGGKPKKRNY